VNWADLMAAQGAFGTDCYDRSILRPKYRAYYRSGRPAIKIGPKGALETIGLYSRLAPSHHSGQYLSRLRASLGNPNMRTNFKRELNLFLKPYLSDWL